jgi:transposase-like protein
MAKSKAKDIPLDERAAIVMAYLTGTPAAELVRRHGISATTLNKWRDRFVQGGQSALASSRKTADMSAAEIEN